MLDENHIVEKSKSLVWAQFRDYGAGELKILDTYLSRINARDPESSRVTFTKKEYAELMGIDQDLRTDQLKNYTRGLLSNVVTLDIPGEGYAQYPLFSEAKCYNDPDIGQVAITIECNEKLKPVFFSLAQNGYVKYELKNILALRSNYSIRLYPQLKDRPFGWTVELDDLRTLIGATAPTYKEFKEFNKSVLQKSIKEINEVTDITVEVENIRRGRSVAAVKFTVKRKNDCLPELPPPDEDDPDQPESVEYIPDPNDPLGMVLEVLPKGFSRESAELLRSLALKYLPYEVSSFVEKEMWLSDYIQSKVMLMNAQNPPVRAKMGWLRKAVDEDWK